MNIKEVAAKYADYQIEMRRYFHRHPELTCYEFNTAKVIREELDKMGVEWKVCGMETNTLAVIKGAKPGKTILLRADIDALPVQEETGVEYASENDGVMHACGHDCHASMLLTAAQILKDMKEDLCGTVVLAFQAAEEQAFGGASMVENGAMDGVDGCFGIHVWADENVPAGAIYCPGGPLMAGAHKFAIDVIGKGGHGANPQACIDPIAATGAVLTTIQSIVSREIDPLTPAVVTVGHVEAGLTYNVIPDSAHMDGTMRCFDVALYKEMPKLLERKVTETAAAYGCKVEFSNRELVPPVNNDYAIADLVHASAKDLFGDAAIGQGAMTMGGEDFSRYLEKAPGAMCQLGIYNEAKDCTYAQHHCKYNVDEDALIKGAMIYAQVALNFNAQ